ncbi:MULTISPECIES: oligosaccharide flippase family protein [Niallia]|uniref:oligosaccharide flippase family protein n=1 Tax=Niallia TaxID=2837506 RepID=UPI0030F7F458
MNSMMKKVGWMLYGQGGRLIFQTIYFLGLAFVFTPYEYGIYVSITAITVILSPFCGVGFNSLLVKIISTDIKSFPKVYGNALKITIYSYVLLLVIGSIAICFLFDNYFEALKLFILISLADLLFLKLTEMSSQIFIAKNSVKVSAHILNFISLIRFMSVLFYFILIKINPAYSGLLNWGKIYLIGSLIFTIYVLIYTFKRSEKPLIREKISLPYIKEGIYFSIGLSSQGVYNDIDKTLLGKYSNLETTGQYGFAYKVLDVLFIPIKAILAITFPMFFKYGQEGGIRKTLRFGLKIMFLLLPLLIVICLLSFYFVPPIIKQLFESKYIESISMFKLLLPIVILRNIHYILADAVTGAGYQKERSIIQIIVAALNFLLNIYFISQFQVMGAIIVSIVSDLLMVLFVAILILYKLKVTKINKVIRET